MGVGDGVGGSEWSGSFWGEAVRHGEAPCEVCKQKAKWL